MDIKVSTQEKENEDQNKLLLNRKEDNKNGMSKIIKHVSTNTIINSISGKKKLTITDFKIIETLGRGAYAKVCLSELKGEYYALKVIDKKFIEKFEKVHEVHTEKQILSQLNHPSIIKMHSTFQDKRSLYFVLDYCKNKDLAEFLRTNVILSKELAQFYSAEIVCALDYLRKNGIAHRDLKPENIMLDKRMKIKIIDFATATKKGYIFDRNKNRFVSELDCDKEHDNCQEEKNYSLVGTAEYVSPEALKSELTNNNFSKDLWALGCIIYRFFEGKTPFREKSEKIIFDKIINQDEVQYTIRTPDVAQDLISKLLYKNPEKRIGFEDFEDLKGHPFFKGIRFENMTSILPPDESCIQIMTSPIKLKKNISHAKFSIGNKILTSKFTEKIDSDEEIYNNIKKSSIEAQSTDMEDEFSELKTNDGYMVGEKEKVHKNTVSTSNTKDAEYEQVKYNLRKSNLKRNSRLDRSNNKNLVRLNEETLVLESIVEKKSPWLHYNKRLIKLYTTPKIDYLDPDSNKIKGTIFLEKDSYAKLIDDNNFDLITKHRTFSFKFSNKSANFWINTINQTIKTSLYLNS